MPVRSAIRIVITAILINLVSDALNAYTATQSDTALVNSLLRHGKLLKNDNPDSAIFYYRQIFEKTNVQPEKITVPVSQIDHAYIKTIIEALNNTGNIYYYNDEYNRSKTYYNRALEYARAAGMDDYTARALFDLGYVHYVNNEYYEAAGLFEDSYGIYDSTRNEKGMYNVRQACGLTYRRLGDFEKADSSYQECLKYATSVHDSMMISDTKTNYGILLCEQGRLEEGIGMFEDALHYYKIEGNEDAISIALLNIGVVLKMVNEYDKALIYIKRSAEMEEIKQQKSQLVVRYYNLADLYLDMGDNNKAFEYCQKIQSVADEIGSKPFVAECNFLFGKYYFISGEYPKAQHYFNLAWTSAANTKNRPLVANIDLWYAKTCRQSGNYKKATLFATNAYQIADDLDLLPVLKDASGILSTVYEQSGNSKAALNWYRIFMAHSDSLSYFNQHKEIARIEAKYNYEQKEQENTILREKASLQEQKLQNRNVVSIALIAGVVLSFVIIILLFRRNRDAKLLYKQQQMLNLQHLQEVEGELDGQKRELASKMMFLNQKNELINRLIKRLQEIQQSPDNSNDELISIVNELRVDAPQSNWKEFETQFTQVHPDFYRRLYEKHPQLSSYEQRICAFLRMNLNTKEIASITGRSAKSIEVARSRIRQKLNLKRDDNLSSFLAAI